MDSGKSITVSLQPAGAVLGWGSFGILLIGLFTFSGPPLLLGLIGLLLLPLARWLAKAQLSDLRIQQHLPRRALMGEPFTVEATITNGKKWLHSSDLHIANAAADSSSPVVVIPYLRKNSSSNFSFPGRLFRRGRNRVETFAIESKWPLGLFEARFSGIYHRDEQEGNRSGVLIVPRPLIPRFLSKVLEQVEREAALHSMLQPDGPAEFRSMREFRSGDRIKNIHWPTSTRSGQLFVRESDPPQPRPQRYGLLLHSYSAAGEIVQPERFEVGLRIATGLLIHFQKRGIPVMFSAKCSEDKILDIPKKSGYLTTLDRISFRLAALYTHKTSITANVSRPHASPRPDRRRRTRRGAAR